MKIDMGRSLPTCQNIPLSYMIPVMSHRLFDALSALPHDTCQFAQGALLFVQGDKVGALHLIETGNVHLVRHQIGGFALTLYRARGVDRRRSLFVFRDLPLRRGGDAGHAHHRNRQTGDPAGDDR